MSKDDSSAAARQPISPEEATKVYGIVTPHERMPNGEVRFRLQKDDGTSYIRTVAGPAGAWQNSHYHTSVKETYIVQQGWIGYAECTAHQPLALYQFKAGEQFTTTPGIIHNVYMPIGAVMHTVKHGVIPQGDDGQPIANGDRYADSAETNEFDRQTHSLTETELLIRCQPGNTRPADAAPSLASTYNEAYRHFDNLIWQVPAGATALFSVVVANVKDLKTTDLLVQRSQLSLHDLIAVFFGLACLFLLLLSYTLFRFRLHQLHTKPVQAPTRWKHLRSPQTGLQLVVNLEAALLLLMALGGVWSGPLLTAAALLLLLTLWQEILLLRARSRQMAGNGQAAATRPQGARLTAS